jgi:DNA repair exonuclease SbcCD nuclease subunit
MRIAITADHHLTTRAKHPDRFETLENILADMRLQGVTTWIIAGDLFDASRQNYAEFEQLCRVPGNRDLTIYLIPGNHDPDIDERKIVADNLHIITSPSVRLLDERVFLFLPYLPKKTMGEEIANLSDQLPAREWVLVGHGDWAGGLRTPNPAEPGVYMPLTRRDIELYRPARVFLGHIHAPMDDHRVHYVGSPCGLDVTETGRRRCLLYDTISDQVEERPVDAPVLYLNESLVIVPAEDEASALRAQIAAMQREWGLSEQEKAKVQLRIKLSGFSSDRAALRRLLDDAFDGFSFYRQAGPDIDEVYSSDDLERHVIAEQVRANLESLDWPGDPEEPNKDEILLKALQVIYGA